MSKISLNDNKHLIQYQIQGHHILPFSFVLVSKQLKVSTCFIILNLTFILKVHVWKKFIEINSKSMNEEPIQFINLRFKNDIKTHPTSKHSHFNTST